MSTSNAPRNKTPAGFGSSINSPLGRMLTTRFSGPEETGFAQNMEGSEELCGNRRYESMMRSMNLLGHFLPMERKANCVTPIYLNINAIREGIRLVVMTVLEAALCKKGYANPAEVEDLARNTTEQLTTGCMMMLYCRLHTVNKSFQETSESYLLKPHVPVNFEIPTPYALAFEGLGLFRVENMTRELELVPHVTLTEAAAYCLGTHRFYPLHYQSALEFAKHVGISFQGVDLKGKLGSAWWLFKSTNETDGHTLQCCIPESNYTDEDAVVRALWCITTTDSLHADIANLSSLTMNRGTFMRNAPPDIAVTCFRGISEDTSEV